MKLYIITIIKSWDKNKLDIMEWIDMVISVRLSLNNMRTDLLCIESNMFINFCGMLIKSELQYLPSEPKFEIFSKMFVIYLRILKIIENNFQYSQIYCKLLKIKHEICKIFENSLRK